MRYGEVLIALHSYLDPEVYLEIGVQTGGSFQHARRRAIGIDPNLSHVRPDLLSRPEFRFFEQTSDDFFRDHRREDVLGEARVDLAFIDGLHHSDQVARDFVNIERWSHPGTLVALHDCWPHHPHLARREVKAGGWTGDCWRIVPFLRRHRPDLLMLMLNARSTGLLLIAGLDPDAPDITPFIPELAAAAAVPPEQQDLDLFRFVAAETAHSPERFLAALGWTPPGPECAAAG